MLERRSRSKDNRKIRANVPHPLAIPICVLPVIFYIKGYTLVEVENFYGCALHKNYRDII
jgi:hypothetical protein